MERGSGACLNFLGGNFSVTMFLFVIHHSPFWLSFLLNEQELLNTFSKSNPILFQIYLCMPDLVVQKLENVYYT